MSDQIPENGTIDVNHHGADAASVSVVSDQAVSDVEAVDPDPETEKLAVKARVERIQGIMQDAFSQTVGELKEGWHEIQTLAKETITSTTGLPNPNETSTEAANAKNATLVNTRAVAIAVFQSLKNRLFTSLQNDYINARQQYGGLKHRVTDVDAKLTERYGDRYANVKQKFERVSTWYNNATAHSESMGVTVLQAKQAEFDRKVGAVGVSAAQKEQQIKQQLKRFLETTAARF